MDRTHFDRAMEGFRERTPFRPYAIALVDGDRVEVDHCDALVVRDGVAICVAAGGVPVVFDHEGVSKVVGDLSAADPGRP